MIEELYDLCETLEKDLEKTNEKLRKSGGELSGSDLEYVDKLTHSLKSIKAVIAMAENEDGYSGRYPMSYAREGRGGGSSNRGGSYRGGSYEGGSYEGGGSYARGRRNAKRDGMGRYSREGYSRAEDFRDTLEEAMENAPNEQTREKLRRIMQEM